MMIDTKAPSVEFTTFDRCDRCGSQALVSATKSSYELLFCLHHGKQHNPALELDGWTIAFDVVAIDRLVNDDKVSV